jgi:hypothetical protein
MNKDLEDLKKYEAENFDVVVENGTFVDDYIQLSVTHNKRQWTSLTFHSTDEIKKVIKALQDYLEK